MADRLEVVIEAIDKASAELRRIRGGVTDVSSAVSESARAITGASDITVASLARMAAGFVSVQAVVGAWSSIIRTGFQEVVAAEQAEVRFVAALRNRGQASQKALNDARALADEMQRTTGVADDLVLSIQATLVQFGGLSGEKLTRATRAVFDLAAAGKDASTVAFTLAKAASGVAGDVGRLGFKMDETLPAAERFDQLLKQIETTAGGTAAALGQTLGGQLDRIKASFTELAEALVKIELARVFRSIGVDAEQGIKALQIFSSTVKIFADNLSGENVADKMAKLGTATAKAAGDVEAKAIPAFKELGATVKTLGEHLSDVSGQSVPDFTSEAHDLGQALNETAALMAKDTEKGAEYAAILKLLAERAEELEEQGIDVPGFDKITVDEIEELKDHAKELTDRQQLLADAVSNLGSEFVRMGILGELSFRNIGQALRSFIADLVAALVRMAILKALFGAFSGGTSAAAGFTFAGGHFGSAPGVPNLPPAGPPIGTPIGGALALNQSFLGVSERFVRDLNEATSRMARQYGVQVVSSEALA